MTSLFDHSTSQARIVNHKAEVSPTLLNRDGETADQSCGFFEGPAVLMFEESGESLNTFVVAVKKPLCHRLECQPMKAFVDEPWEPSC